MSESESRDVPFPRHKSMKPIITKEMRERRKLQHEVEVALKKAAPKLLKKLPEVIEQAPEIIVGLIALGKVAPILDKLERRIAALEQAQTRAEDEEE